MKKHEKNISNFEDFLLAGVIIFGLAIHLFTIHSRLLYHLNPDKIIELYEYSLTWDLFSVKYRVSTISAITYSAITAFILWKFVKYFYLFLLVVVSFAILDGLGVRIYYNVNVSKEAFINMGSWYYTIYTSVMIISIGIYRMNKLNSKNESEPSNNIQDNSKVNKIYTPYNDAYSLEDNVMSLDRSGWSQTKIAKELNISQPKVSRTLKKLK